MRSRDQIIPPIAARRITLCSYANFQQTLSATVVVDPNLPVTGVLRAGLTKSPTFQFTIDDALMCAQRHLFVAKPTGAKSPPSLKVVRDWLHLLRWETMTFWDCDPAKNTLSDESGSTTFSFEHPRRAGELIAEGVALLFFERQLGINRNRFYFYSHSDARPDYVVSGNVRVATALIATGGKRIALECRCRKNAASIRASDYQALANKKAQPVQKPIKYKGVSRTKTFVPSSTTSPFASVLLVYLSYGRKAVKLIIGDPESPADDASFEEELRVILLHYLFLCRRIGLWYHASVIDEAFAAPLPVSQLAERRDPGMGGDHPLPRFEVGGIEFLGRFFSEFALAVLDGRIPRDSAQERLISGDYDFFYYGLDLVPLGLIRRREWRALARYAAAPGTVTPDVAIGSDGSALIDGNGLGPDADLLTEVLGLPPRPREEPPAR